MALGPLTRSTQTAELRFLAVPYYLGRENPRVAAGVPLLVETLAADNVRHISIRPGGELANDVSESFAVIRELAGGVRESVAAGAAPVVLAVNCYTALGTVAGLGTPDDLGVIWFDGHSDFDTPDTSIDGFIDGMGLAMLTGSGWEALRASVPGLRPVPGPNVVLVGARKLDAIEERDLAEAGISHVRPGEPLDVPLDQLAARARGVYVHVDLDVLDPSEGKANWVAREGGLSATDLFSAAEAIASRFDIRAVAFTAYVPECDPDLRIPRIAKAVLERLAPGIPH
jgi:arginase